jgi:peroxiredoxin
MNVNKLLSSLLVSVLLYACQVHDKSDQFTISVKLKGIENGKAFLKRYNGTNFFIVDSTEFVKNSFSFRGTVSSPELYRIFISGFDAYIPLFVENSEISIVIDSNNFSNTYITGSKSDSIYKLFCRQIDSIDNVMQPVVEQYKDAQIRGNNKLSLYYEALLDSNYNKQIQFTKQFVEQHVSSTVAVFIIYKYLSGELNHNELKSLSLKIDTSLKNSTYFICLNNQIEIEQRTEVGQKATEFSLTDTSGTSIKLSSFSGKYVLIDFWASWCPPCREENPNVVEAYKKFGNKGFAVLGISFDSKRDKWLKAIYDDKLTWTQLSDLRGWENAIGNLYGIRAIPSNLLIGPDGTILAKNLRGKALHEKLKALLH